MISALYLNLSMWGLIFELASFPWRPSANSFAIVATLVLQRCYKMLSVGFSEKHK